MSEALPCPFCGGKPEMVSDINRKQFWRCEDAKCAGGGHYVGLVRWNTRTPTAEQATRAAPLVTKEGIEAGRIAIAEMDGCIEDGKIMCSHIEEDCWCREQARAALEAAFALARPAPALFQIGNFTLASGAESTWKIECDVLSAGDWAALAAVAVEKLPLFGSVEGVPRGGLAFAEALRPYATNGPLLIAEDVVTTGGSMERFRAGREAIGVAAFARGAVPTWVTPLFSLVVQPTPTETDREVAIALVKGWADYLHPKTPAAVVSELTATLASTSAQGRESGLEEAAKVAEGGRFLHEDAPDARFGKACAAAIRALKSQPDREN